MKYFSIAVLLMLFITATAQPDKTAQPTQSQLDKMMKEAMKDMTAEGKKQVQEAMSMAKDMQKKGMKGLAASVKIPKKQTVLLSKIPVIRSQQQYAAYLAALLSECKKNIPAAVITEVDKIIAKYNDKDARVNIAPVLFLQQKPKASVYAAIRTAMFDPSDVLLQDNLAVILHQTGYPQKALPILQYLLPQYPAPIILNNIGQSYLSLGDTANARRYFMGCLEKDPNHCEANCGMGLLLAEAGKISEAAAYIIRSLKNGYTATADHLATEHKIKMKFIDIRQEVPAYFNPQQFKPVPPAYTMAAVEPTEALRATLLEQMREWVQKKQTINEAQRSKMDTENLAQLTDRHRGFLSNNMLAKKAKLMITLLGASHGEFVAKDFKNQYMPLEITLNKQLEKNLKNMYGGNQKYDNEYEQCVKKISILNEHLPKSAKNHEAYQRETLPNIYEWVNQSLYWWYFLSNEEQYRMHFTNFVSDFFEALHDYDQMQNLHPTPLWISTTCKNVTEPVKVKNSSDSLEIYCPINVKVNAGIGSYKLNCKGMEIEGGELLILGFEEDFQTGEFSFAFGLGVEARLGIFSAGTKGQMFFKFDKDFSPIDCGLKAESGGEANVAGYTIEEKMVGVMGMASGIHVDAVSAGKTTNIFAMDPGK